jgi:signal transduction histidine kinase/ActR/RegA family two-component response regulator
MTWFARRQEEGRREGGHGSPDSAISGLLWRRGLAPVQQGTGAPPFSPALEIASNWRGYTVAFLSIALATAIRWLLHDFLGHAVPFTLFYPAIMISAWYGGLGPGLFSTAVCVPTAELMFLPPPYSLFRIRASEAFHLTLFVVAGVMISVLSESLHRARRRAEAAQADLSASMERERASRLEAEAANCAKDEFLATVSHELRTPLTSILTWAHMLRGGALDGATTGRAIESIERGARSQAQLIEDLLDVSRIISGKLRLEVRQIELPPVMEAAIDTVRPGADAKQIHLESTLDPNAGPVSGDPQRLQQVVWNLLSNAIKFTPQGGRIRVGLRRVDAYAEVVVADTGRGIRADFLPRVFERFSQADSGSTRVAGGLGLGLAIVRHLVELHGGTVDVASPGEGQGATFTVRLPILAVAALRASSGMRPTAERATVPASPQIAGVRVLLVDDEPETLATLTAFLEERGAQIKAASSVGDAFEAFQAWRPDVLVSDIGMPEEDGYALIHKIRDREREHGGHVPAIALTAYARIEDRLKILSSGFQMHVPKPVDPVELVTVIASVSHSLPNA